MSTCQTDPATDDVAFARAIFEWMPEHLCLDRSRLFAMGFSNGGAMTFRLQCEFSHLLRAISVTGMRLARDWAPGGALCQPETSSISGIIPTTRLRRRRCSLLQTRVYKFCRRCGNPGRRPPARLCEVTSIMG